jgi:DNA processing protein
VIERDLEPLLQLYSVPGVGGGRMRNLISAFGSARAVLDAPLQQLIRVQGVERATAVKIKTAVEPEFVDRQLEFIEKNGVKILSYWDDDYPARLKKIYDPPPFLFVEGEISPADERALGIVGTRIPSAYGKAITEQFARELVGHNFTIVSGLARGVDTVAHDSALRSGGRTIAVLGCGLDYVYPPENKKLWERIREAGAIITEYPAGTYPDPRNFPRRNRIISGMSIGILITEAGAKSGGLITAFQALEQNREVFSVPGPINSGKSAGTNQLIKEGAKLVQGTRDIMLELEGMLNGNGPFAEPEPPKLMGVEKLVYEALSEEPVHVDTLAGRCNKSVPEVLTALLTLELLGHARQLSGKMFIRS